MSSIRSAERTNFPSCATGDCSAIAGVFFLGESLTGVIPAIRFSVKPRAVSPDTNPA